MSGEPTDGLAPYQSVKRVLAGQITKVVEAGCYVQEANGDVVLRLFEPYMTTRRAAFVGDMWCVTEGGGCSWISQRATFEKVYFPVEAPRPPT